MSVASINPATGELLETFEETPPAEVEATLARGAQAASDWAGRPVAERARCMHTAAGLLRARRDRYAATIVREMGKPVAQAEAEIEKCAWVAEYYAEHAEEFLRELPRPTEAAYSAIHFDPLGLVLAIMPWNFPFFQVFRAAVPALTAGNCVLLKHAPNVTRCSLEIAALWREAGLPAGAFQVVVVPAEQVAALVADPRVSAVTLTGSTRAGSAVASAAGGALKKAVLELGGSDPFVVLADADLPAAARGAADARLINSGQSCIAAKRFIAVAPVYERFLDALVGEMAARRMGDPTDRATSIGPQARADLRSALHGQVEATRRRGARSVLGGTLPVGAGFFYPPTVLVDVQPGMPAFDEELFGPVAAVVRAGDENEAIRLANATSYGLGASLWTTDLARARRLVPQVAAGSVFVNSVVRSDPRLPFGGVKRSGYGRELSEFGLREFVNVKTVWIAAAGR